MLVVMSMFVRLAYSQDEEVNPDSGSWYLQGDLEKNLISAAETDDLKAARILVRGGVPVDTRTYDGVTPLMYAAQNGFLELTALLIEIGADVNAVPDNGVTPLMGAVRMGHYEVAEILIGSGAGVDALDYTKLSALMHAAAYNYKDIVYLLLSNGANIRQTDWFGSDALMFSVYYGCYESAKTLLEFGADVNHADTSGFTPLMVAAQNGEYDLAWLLLDRGADPLLQNKGGYHALALAIKSEELDITELLLENGADVNQPINHSRNPLEMAMDKKNTELTGMIIAAGAKVNRAPDIAELKIGMNINLNADDFMCGFDVGVREKKNDLFATTGFLFRPSAVRILRQENDSLYYQFWERRYAWIIQMGKNFHVVNQEKKKAGVRIRLLGVLTWGNYRGASTKAGAQYIIVPSAGLYLRGRNAGMSADYLYVPLKLQSTSPHRFELGVNFFIGLKSDKYSRKEIGWF